MFLHSCIKNAFKKTSNIEHNNDKIKEVIFQTKILTTKKRVSKNFIKHKLLVS